MIRIVCQATGSGTRIYLYCFFFLEPILFGWIPAQPRDSGEVLGHSPKQCTLSSLRSGEGMGWECK